MLLLLSTVAAAAMPNPGTPANVPPEVDCAVRRLAYEYGQHLLPERGSFLTLFEALQLQFCNMSTPQVRDVYSPPRLSAPASTSVVLHVASSASRQLADGSEARPFPTLKAAVAAAAGKRNATILVHGGRYHLTEPLQLTSAHSGLTIQNFDGAAVTVSGGVAFNLPKSAWKPYKQSVRWETSTNVNNVNNQAVAGHDSDGIVFLGIQPSTEACAAAAKANSSFSSWTYHTPKFAGPFNKQCFGRTDGAWAPIPATSIDSGVLIKQNVWMADLSHLDMSGGMPGLRVNGDRAIRAKYPNGDPEQSGSFLRGANQGMGGGDYVKGWIPLAARTEWVPPKRKPDSTEIIVTAKDWPNVEWPMKEKGGSSWTGEGDWGEYHVGMGGYCDDLDPPYGYWCAMHPPRGQCWNKATNKGSGCTQTHMSPDGMVLERALNYSKPEGAVIQSWRGGGRWFTQQWLVTGFVKENATLLFDPMTGMQGGEGMTSSGQFWIENVLEEVDDAREYYYDETLKRLYYNPNSTTEGPTGEEEWVATQTRALINISGTMEAPVTDVTIRGLSFRDTRYTYLDTHSMLS